MKWIQVFVWEIFYRILHDNLLISCYKLYDSVRFCVFLCVIWVELIIILYRKSDKIHLPSHINSYICNRLDKTYKNNTSIENWNYTAVFHISSHHNFGRLEKMLHTKWKKKTNTIMTKIDVRVRADVWNTYTI